jgi:hypothetical protein
VTVWPNTWIGCKLSHRSLDFFRKMKLRLSAEEPDASFTETSINYSTTLPNPVRKV